MRLFRAHMASFLADNCDELAFEIQLIRNDRFQDRLARGNERAGISQEDSWECQLLRADLFGVIEIVQSKADNLFRIWNRRQKTNIVWTEHASLVCFFDGSADL